MSASTATPAVDDTTVGSTGDSPVDYHEVRLVLSPKATKITMQVMASIGSAMAMVSEFNLIEVNNRFFGASPIFWASLIAAFLFPGAFGAQYAARSARRPIEAFAKFETVLALTIGVSTTVLFYVFSTGVGYLPALYGFTMLIGFLVGCEWPLYGAMHEMTERVATAKTMADLQFADYIGVPVGAAAFLIMLYVAKLGMMRAAIAAGFILLTCGSVVFWLFHRTLTKKQIATKAVAVLVGFVALGVLWGQTHNVEITAKAQLFDAPIVHDVDTAFQNIVVTERRSLSGEAVDTRIFLNGDLQSSSVDEYRYHEMLVHPVIAAGTCGDVIIFGGGDGYPLREILKYDCVTSVTQVELDPEMIRFASTELAHLNNDAYDDPRVTVVNEDAFVWVNNHKGQEQFDSIIVDFPDPDSTSLGKLYSQEFYGMVKRMLAPDAHMVVQSGSPYFAPKPFWSIGKTLASVGLNAVPYQADVPSFGNWGFWIATADSQPVLTVPTGIELNYLTEAVFEASMVFPPDVTRHAADVEVSTLDNGLIVKYAQESWKQY